MPRGAVAFLFPSLLCFPLGPLKAQRNVQAFPKEAKLAKTVSVVNNTHNDAVEQGAMEALKRWGRLRVSDDPDNADIVLTFDKKGEHSGSSKQDTGADGKPNSSYSMTFGSSITMKAALKAATSSFYSTTTSESKKKAGAECMTSLQGAFNTSP